jgi:hypothetical protein
MTKPHPAPSSPHADPVAHLLGRVAHLMDRAFTVPGTNVRFGLDGLVGLLPLGGDLATGLVQTGLVLIALGRYRVPPGVAARMMGNVLLDVGFGTIPLLGDLFDVAFKANTRNMALLEPYLHPGRIPIRPGKSPGTRILDVTPAGTSWGCVLAIAVALLGSLLLVLIGLITVVRWLRRGWA